MIGLLLGIFFSCTPKKEAIIIGDIPVCGTVQFSDGCSPELDKAISYGIALVHHMTFEEADTVFAKVMAADSSCFWGPWGKALTFIHPLWNDPPSKDKLEEGWSLSQKALKLARTEKEISYGKALAGFYENGVEKSETERLANYNAGWQAAHESNPNDLEAKAFYALTLIATADPADLDFKNQKKAYALATEVLQVIKDHPGGFHYIIHSNDYPGLAVNALDAAKTYSSIAPEIPHALHMPSHIFTRRGMWDESIDWNTRSATSAKERPVKGKTSRHYFHAVDYLVYAYLQKGEDEKAKAALEEMKNLHELPDPHGATAYALAAAEARTSLERHDWKRASALAGLSSENFPWDKFSDFQSVKQFAIGLGAARSGSKEIAQRSLKLLDSLKPFVKHPYFVKQVDVQKNIINAWLAFNTKSEKTALDLMKQASEAEWSMQKHPVTPGELLPSRELYGDMLLELGHSKEALVQYEMTLERSPGRLNSVFGAAQAADLSGDKAKAKRYYEQVRALTAGADASFVQRIKALKYLEQAG